MPAVLRSQAWSTPCQENYTQNAVGSVVKELFIDIGEINRSVESANHLFPVYCYCTRLPDVVTGYNYWVFVCKFSRNRPRKSVLD